MSEAPVLGHAIQKSPVMGLGHVLLEVLGIGENLSTLLESLGVGQVSSSQPTGIPHTAQQEGVSETLNARLIYTNKNKITHAHAPTHSRTHTLSHFCTDRQTYEHTQRCIEIACSTLASHILFVIVMRDDD